MATYSAIMGWPAHEGEVSCVRFTHDETSIVSTGSDGKVRQTGSAAPLLLLLPNGGAARHDAEWAGLACALRRSN